MSKFSINQCYVLDIVVQCEFTEWKQCQQLLDIFFKRVAKKFIFQYEVTDVINEYENEWERFNAHFQCYVNLRTKLRTEQAATMVREAIKSCTTIGTVHVSPCSSNGMLDLQQYCMKAESRCEGPWADHPIYTGQDLWEEVKMPVWQQDLLKYCKEEVKDREIMWVFDPIGGQGKSKFGKYMAFRHDAVYLLYDSTSQLLYQVVSRGPKRVYVVNLTKAKPQQIGGGDLYSAIESIKDGHVVSNKYQGGALLFSPPIVIVMSNHRPDEEHMTAGRFKVVDLTPLRASPVAVNSQESYGLDVDLIADYELSQVGDDLWAGLGR